MNGPPFNAAANVADTHVVLINDELFIKVASFSHSSVNFCMSKWSSAVGLLRVGWVLVPTLCTKWSPAWISYINYSLFNA